ncbi:MAG: alpha-1,4-glucan--maltose-1-phosphate maltosyltransferase [bacterium]
MERDGRRRVVIERVTPQIDGGRFPLKRVTGERIMVSADVFADGHDDVAAVILFRREDEEEWRESPMTSSGNDVWEGSFSVEAPGFYSYTVGGWIDRFGTWSKDLRKTRGAGQEVGVKLLVGAGYVEAAAERAAGIDMERLRQIAAIVSNREDIEQAVSVGLGDELAVLMERYPDRGLLSVYERELPLVVDREKALFSTWYEIFPRSCSPEPGGHGTFKDCEGFLPELERMGFDVLYLPPIHPIGRTKRKGKDNAPAAGPDDPGSPWAIGSEEGGHTSVHPLLGTMEDFEDLVKKAAGHGIEIALDLAFQCSNDHPYLKEHPEWFQWRPDGTIQFAENPPKRYEDIVPFFFETDHWHSLWEELKGIVLFWIEKGVRIFRVDNPHTKPFSFWEWLIREVKRQHPDALFLAEAFTRPKVMNRLAKLGFTQSYTYFTWRNTKQELTAYLTELISAGIQEYLRPCFWPTTPDILPEFLQYDGRSAFLVRLVLAATLSSNYGLYGPPFELFINEGVTDREEYINSEKYEVRHWDVDAREDNLRDFIARVNAIRRNNKALQATGNLRFCEVDNEYLLAFVKASEDLSNIVMVVVNLDPFHTQSGFVKIPLDEMGIVPGQPYLVTDLISDDKYLWQGDSNHVELAPSLVPAHIFRVHRRLRREADFDYFM